MPLQGSGDPDHQIREGPGLPDPEIKEGGRGGGGGGSATARGKIIIYSERSDVITN